MQEMLLQSLRLRYTSNAASVDQVPVQQRGVKMLILASGP